MPANIHEPTHESSQAPPRLAKGITLTTLRNLPDWSTAPRASGRALFDALKAGYARTFVDPATGERREESDRYEQAHLLADLAQQWWKQLELTGAR